MQRLFRHPGFRQFVKFCIVGGSSTILDMGLLWLMLRFLPHFPWWLSQSIAFAVSVSNGFYWNRHWTFKAREFGKAHTQYSIFVMTNLVGLGINLFVMKFFLVLLTGKVFHGAQNPDRTKVLIAYVLAVPFGVIWNYLAAKHWTFREPKENLVATDEWKPATNPINSETFESIISTNQIVVIHFWAKWDLIDRKMDAIIENVRPKFTEEIAFYCCDTVSEENWEICRQYINNIPALCCFVNGQYLETSTGLLTEDVLESKLLTWKSNAHTK